MRRGCSPSSKETLKELLAVANEPKEESELEALEREKSELKTAYEEAYKEAKELKSKLDQLIAKSEKLSPEEREASQIDLAIEPLKKELQEKKFSLNQQKSELVEVERELYILKKEQQQSQIEKK